MRHRRLVLAVAIAVLLVPSGVSAQSSVETIVGDIDAFWAHQFADLGLTYTSPQLVPVDGPLSTDCGELDPAVSPGAYCPANDTIYYSTMSVVDSPDADVLQATVLAHEWGHHIQWLTDTGVSTTLEAEQQADCFAGAYMRHAEEEGLVSPEAVTQSLSLTQSAGDVWFYLPPGAPEHGDKSQRAIAFMTGMNGGVEACGL
jgi:uncharacterized protein